MKITLSTINKDFNINFDGSVKAVPKKYAVMKRRTLGGRLKQRYAGVYRTFSVNVSFLTASNYDTFLDIWEYSEDMVIIKTDSGSAYIGIIVDLELNFTQQYDEQGNEFYTGTFTIEQ